ncbi:MAG TPA: hypothetical protein DCS29_03340 [Candidatus Magasanikbacteria bacterium]|nr:MAG: hypothetical protein A2479_01420 [Candidatus Magasanikbacteria bacterium RIFOXYC2_FULL_39_8]HAT03780.1 hypothetical protein [Candidatus Magasanikbacteria bacterium]
MNDIIGHTEILNFFDTIITQGRLSHAYCFAGPEHVGKQTIARELAARILHIDRDRLHTSPDFTYIERIPNEKTGKMKKDISIEQIRDVVNVLSQRAFYPNGYKVVIIDHAEFMSTGAANALLKTLEEPKEKTVLFLITSDEKRLLPTIQSRCQIIYFTLVGAQEILSALRTRNVDDAETIAQESSGLPGRAVYWCEHRDSYEAYTREIERFNKLFGTYFYEKLGLVEELFGDKVDHIVARDHLQDVLGIWQLQIPRIVSSGIVRPEMAGQLYEDIGHARLMLEKNVHPRLLVEHILLQLP